MVGIFSRFSGRHRRTQSSFETLPLKAEVGGSTHVTIVHGMEIAVELKPVEHPTEPLNCDQPIKCPLPEPSILNDGRIWKEKMSSANVRPRDDLPVVKEESQLDSEACRTRHRTVPAKGYMSSSFSAPEHNLINLVEEYNAAEDHSAG